MVSLFGLVFPVIYAHVGALLALVVVIAIADKEALAWIRGKKETLSATLLDTLHTLVSLGLILMILSGLLLAWPLKDYLIETPAFYVKTFFVIVLIINSFFIGKFMKVASERAYASLSEGERRMILISGGVSAASWVGAFIAALFMSANQWLFSFWKLLF